MQAVPTPGLDHSLESEGVKPVRLKVLLIDDEKGFHQALRALLVAPPPSNIDLISAYNLHDGANMLIGDDRPDVLLLDLNLGDDWRAPQTLACIPRLSRTVPVIVLTGFGTDALWVQAAQGGALNFLQKDVYLDPRNRGFLLHAIANAYFVHQAICAAR